MHGAIMFALLLSATPREAGLCSFPVELRDPPAGLKGRASICILKGSKQSQSDRLCFKGRWKDPAPSGPTRSARERMPCWGAQRFFSVGEDLTILTIGKIAAIAFVPDGQQLTIVSDLCSIWSAYVKASVPFCSCSGDCGPGRVAGCDRDEPCDDACNQCPERGVACINTGSIRLRGPVGEPFTLATASGKTELRIPTGGITDGLAVLYRRCDAPVLTVHGRDYVLLIGSGELWEIDISSTVPRGHALAKPSR